MIDDLTSDIYEKKLEKNFLFFSELFDFEEDQTITVYLNASSFKEALDKIYNHYTADYELRSISKVENSFTHYLP